MATEISKASPELLEQTKAALEGEIEAQGDTARTMSARATELQAQRNAAAKDRDEAAAEVTKATAEAATLEMAQRDAGRELDQAKHKAGHANLHAQAAEREEATGAVAAVLRQALINLGIANARKASIPLPDAELEAACQETAKAFLGTAVLPIVTSRYDEAHDRLDVVTAKHAGTVEKAATAGMTRDAARTILRKRGAEFIDLQEAHAKAAKAAERATEQLNTCQSRLNEIDAELKRRAARKPVPPPKA